MNLTLLKGRRKEKLEKVINNTRFPVDEDTDTVMVLKINKNGRIKYEYDTNNILSLIGALDVIKTKLIDKYF